MNPKERVMRSTIRKRKKRNKIGQMFKIFILCAISFYLIFILVDKIISDRNLSLHMESKGNYENIDISKEIIKGEIPLFLQTDSRWGDAIYGDGRMAETGCGPTCLSMVYSGLTGNSDWNPYKLACKAEMDGYYVIGSGSAWNMMTELAEELGLIAYEVPFSENSIRAELENEHPIICIMGPGDFTTAGHFIVLTGMKDDGSIIVNDPNSIENSKRVWDLNQLMRQMRNLWGYQVR